jgi:hypothetical protein
MNIMALRSNRAFRQEAFETPVEDLLPLRWSVLIWLVLAAGSWVIVIFGASLIF